MNFTLGSILKLKVFLEKKTNFFSLGKQRIQVLFVLDPVSLKVFSESEFLLLLGAIAVGFM